MKLPCTRDLLRPGRSFSEATMGLWLACNAASSFHLVLPCPLSFLLRYPVNSGHCYFICLYSLMRISRVSHSPHLLGNEAPSPCIHLFCCYPWPTSSCNRQLDFFVPGPILYLSTCADLSFLNLVQSHFFSGMSG